MSPARLLRLATALLLAGCATDSNWYLMEAGYSINPVDGEDSTYAIEVHRNQLRQLGDDVNSPEFRLFVVHQLRNHGLCPAGWRPLPCVRDGSCVQHTKRSVTVTGRCEAS